MQEGGAWSLYIIFHDHNYQGDIGKFIYKALIVENKQLLSNMIECEATQVPYTTSIAFLTDCLPHRLPYILLKLPSHSLHYCYSYMKAALLNKNSN